MVSFDIFDTLIGRWYYTPESIAEEMQTNLNIENFAWYRKHAENSVGIKTYQNIHNKLQELLGYDDLTRDFVQEYEFSLEIKRTFPIEENIRKLDSDSLLISDTYFSPEELKRILTSNGVHTYRQILSSYDGKSSGRVWDSVQTQLHLGDNIESDFNIPRRRGIDCVHYTNSMYTDPERYLVGNGYSNLANLSRAVRLQNRFSGVDASIWDEQAMINLPLLVLISNYISNYFSDNGKFDKVLFTQRDCYNLYNIFSLLYPNIKIDKLYSNRELYTNPTANFRRYTDALVGNCNPLVVDMQGTGNTFINYFTNLNVNNYLPVVYSDLESRHNFTHLAHRSLGISDKIERINYSPFSSTKDIGNDGVAIAYPHCNKYISIQQQAQSIALGIIMDGFALERSYNKDVLIWLLMKLEATCKICGVVNHEEI